MYYIHLSYIVYGNTISGVIDNMNILNTLPVIADCIKNVSKCCTTNLVVIKCIKQVMC
jgi:hypothetical protein